MPIMVENNHCLFFVTKLLAGVKGSKLANFSINLPIIILFGLAEGKALLIGLGIILGVVVAMLGTGVPIT